MQVLRNAGCAVVAFDDAGAALLTIRADPGEQQGGRGGADALVLPPAPSDQILRVLKRAVTLRRRRPSKNRDGLPYSRSR